MKKLYLLFLALTCLSAANAFAESPCDNMQPQTINQRMKNKCSQPCEQIQKKDCQTQVSECFLCTKAHTATLFKQLGLSDSQICTAMKIQEKYEQEVLSLNEKLHCEKVKLYQMNKNCAKKSEIWKQKHEVKKLKKAKKEICEYYEKQFKAILSGPQKKCYNKYKNQ